jgi:hypothetical protein
MAEVIVPPGPGKYLYLVGASRDGPIKVGISQNPLVRLWELQTGSSRPLSIYWVYPCPHGDVWERVIHQILWRRRLVGEWFDVPVEDAMGALWIAAQGDGKMPTEQELRQWRLHIGLILPGEGQGLLAGARARLEGSGDADEAECAIGSDRAATNGGDLDGDVADRSVPDGSPSNKLDDDGTLTGESAAALCAPPGECEYCDRRRAYAASSMRRSRAKRTGGSDG